MDFAPDVTPRYRAHYVSAGIPHTMLVRTLRSQTQAEVVAIGQTFCAGLVAAIQAYLADDFAFTSAEFIPKDSNIAVAAAAPANPTGAITVASMSPQDKITHATFSGKSTAETGSKVSVKVFGIALSYDSTTGGAKDFVINPGEDANFTAATDFLATQGFVKAIDQGTPVWYERVNLKPNDFYLRKVRKGLIT